MTILKKDLEPSPNNNLNSYFPVRTSNSGDAYDWEYAKAIVIRNLYQRVVSKDVTKSLNESEIEINEIKAAYKLSQTRPEDHPKIIEELNTREQGSKEVAKMMKNKNN